MLHAGTFVSLCVEGSMELACVSVCVFVRERECMLHPDTHTQISRELAALDRTPALFYPCLSYP